MRSVSSYTATAIMSVQAKQYSYRKGNCHLDFAAGEPSYPGFTRSSGVTSTELQMPPHEEDAGGMVYSA